MLHHWMRWVPCLSASNACPAGTAALQVHLLQPAVALPACFPCPASSACGPSSAPASAGWPAAAAAPVRRDPASAARAPVCWLQCSAWQTLRTWCAPGAAPWRLLWPDPRHMLCCDEHLNQADLGCCGLACVSDVPAEVVQLQLVAPARACSCSTKAAAQLHDLVLRSMASLSWVPVSLQQVTVTTSCSVRPQLGGQQAWLQR